MQTQIRKFLRERTDVQSLAFIMLLLGIGAIVVGYLQQHVYVEWLNILDNAIADFYANASSELISIAITVLIIERANKKQSELERKAELILQMGSRDNTFATEAIRILRLKKWHSDRSLSHANLQRANLNDADLSNAVLDKAELTAAELNNANLSNASLIEAQMGAAQLEEAYLDNCVLVSAYLYNVNLKNAKLRNANLYDAKLEKANLQGAWLANADLRKSVLRNTNFQNASLLADLRGADLTNASLQGVRLWLLIHRNGFATVSDQVYPPDTKLITKYSDSELLQATFDTTTILPDGNHWTSSTDMSAFVHPSQQKPSAPRPSTTPRSFLSFVSRVIDFLKRLFSS